MSKFEDIIGGDIFYLGEDYSTLFVRIESVNTIVDDSENAASLQTGRCLYIGPSSTITRVAIAKIIPIETAEDW